jgi:hypothetical protein
MRPTTSGMSRREFAEVLALAALAPMLGSPVAPGNWVHLTPVGLGRSGLTAKEPGAIAQALAGVIRAQYGDRLGQADLEVVTQQIQNGLDRAEKVRKAALGNGDEPDFVFSAIRVETIG